MPTFARTTTSGQSIPGGGMTLDALMARQKELAERQMLGIEQPQTTVPGGIGMLVGTALTGLAESRARRQEIEGRQALAQAMSRINPETGGFGSTADQATASQLDPDFAYKVIQAGIEGARAREAERVRVQERLQQHGWDEASAAREAAALVAKREDEQAEARRTAETLAGTQAVTREDEQAEARTTAETLAGTNRQTATTLHERNVAEQQRQETVEAAKPASDVGKIMQDYNAGKYGAVGSPEAVKLRDAEVAKATALPVSSTTVNVGGEGALTPGQKKIDESFAPDYVEWKQTGAADLARQAAQLEKALGILESGQGVTGAINLLGDTAGAFINPDGTIAREAVQEVAQRSLKAVLGAQFTQLEGEKILARAFNPLLEPKENARRARLLLRQVQGIAQAKQAMVEYFDKNGTLRGYNGPQLDLRNLPTFENEENPEPSVLQSIFDRVRGAGNGATAEPSIDEIMKKYGG